MTRAAPAYRDAMRGRSAISSPDGDRLQVNIPKGGHARIHKGENGATVSVHDKDYNQVGGDFYVPDASKVDCR